MCHHKAPPSQLRAAPREQAPLCRRETAGPETFSDDYSNRQAAAAAAENAHSMRHDIQGTSASSSPKGGRDRRTASAGLDPSARSGHRGSQNCGDSTEPPERTISLPIRGNSPSSSTSAYMMRYLADHCRRGRQCRPSARLSRRRRPADDTIVIYTSDQGFFLGEHGWFDKRFMYKNRSRCLS